MVISVIYYESVLKQDFNLYTLSVIKHH